MPTWAEMLIEVEALPNDNARSQWITQKFGGALSRVSQLRNGSNVVLYGSAWLQKPQAPAPSVSLGFEDLNGFMTVLHGFDWSKPLTLILHTPGGSPNAAETIVGYLRSKFREVEVIVPTYAFSAGTMVALSANRIVMGRQSQLGPIDPQFVMGPQLLSAQSIVDQFETAKTQILANPMAAHAWAPILSTIGPALLQEAENALSYGERIVRTWLASYMFAGRQDNDAIADRVAKHFNAAQTHLSHGRRIDRDEARGQGLTVEDLETDQDLQDAVLTAYHCMTLIFEKSQAAKIITSSSHANWLKNWGASVILQQPPLGGP